MENQNNQQTREKKRLVVDPEPFHPIGELKIMTSTKLCEKINRDLKAVFKDYYGCRMQVQMQPDRGSYYIIPHLMFQVLPDDQYGDGIFAFKPMSKLDTDDLGRRVQRLHQMSTTKGAKVDITIDAQDIFEEFMIKPSGKSIDWKNCYNSIRTDQGTYIELFKIDPIALLKLLWGSKDEFGSEVYYQITPAYKLNRANQYNASDEWVLNILRLNHDDEVATAKELGMYVAPRSGIDVVTTT